MQLENRKSQLNPVPKKNSLRKDRLDVRKIYILVSECVVAGMRGKKEKNYEVV